MDLGRQATEMLAAVAGEKEGKEGQEEQVNDSKPEGEPIWKKKENWSPPPLKQGEESAEPQREDEDLVAQYLEILEELLGKRRGKEDEGEKSERSVSHTAASEYAEIIEELLR